MLPCEILYKFQKGFIFHKKKIQCNYFSKFFHQLGIKLTMQTIFFRTRLSGRKWKTGLFTSVHHGRVAYHHHKSNRNWTEPLHYQEINLAEIIDKKDHNITRVIVDNWKEICKKPFLCKLVKINKSNLFCGFGISFRNAYAHLTLHTW